MSHFTFTTTDHEFSLREQADMKRALLTQIVYVPLWQRAVQWRGFSTVGSFMPVAAFASKPVLAGALSLVLIVGVGGYKYATFGPTPAETVAQATDVLIHELEQGTPVVATFVAADARVAKSADVAEVAMQSAEGEVVPQTVTDALATIDTALTGSSVVSDVPIARIVASLASLESLAETHIEDGVGTSADEAVLAYIADRKSLITLLVSTASNEEKLAIHTAAAEFILEDVRSHDDAVGVFAETFIATRMSDDTVDLLDDLATVKAVATARSL